MRFHRLTPDFARVRANLMSSDLAGRVVESGGHLWIPLDVPIGVDEERTVETLVAEADRVTADAYRGLEPNPNRLPDGVGAAR
jgi:hypothetical protein